MPGRSVVPSHQHGESYVPTSASGLAAGTAPPPRTPPSLAEPSVPWGRYLSAIWRFKWLIAAIIAVGSTGGVLATRMVSPVYEAEAKVWISAPDQQQQARGPISGGQLLRSVSWVELLRSYALADSVVERLRLYVIPRNTAEAPLFASLAVGDDLRSGRYVLRVDSTGRSWRLETGRDVVVERGAVGDSVGRAVGMRWRPAPAELRPSREISFFVQTPRSAATGLVRSLEVSMPEESNFISLRLRGTDPRRIARTLNVWAEEFVRTSARLKKRNLTSFERTLGEQLATAERELRAAEMALAELRAEIISQPTEGGPVAGGVEATQTPLLNSYFSRKEEYDNIRHDRIALEAIVAQSRTGQLSPDAVLSIPSVVTGAPLLQNALTDLSTRQAQLRSLRQTLTEEHPQVRAAAAGVQTLERETIPGLAQSLVLQLRQRESSLAGRITEQSKELRNIPQRTIEEMRLRRQVTVSENLYNMLKARYEETQLAEASATADVSILDAAEPPQYPSSNTAPRILLLAFVASVGGAIALVLLLDRLDHRFRYPEQATHELGLGILGTVPAMRKQRRKASDEAIAQVLEAFRALRLGIRYACADDRGLAVAISSPGPSDGKSMISANLALSLSESGVRTVLIDGDIRRGELQAIMGTDSTPGLVDYLAGRVPLEEAIRATNFPNLKFIPAGTRQQRAPELLVSSRLPELIGRLRGEFDAIILDTPPLVAGMDAYALAASVGNLALVLRSGVTDRKMADAKLKVVDRLPINVVGAILNGFDVSGQYRYYAYSYSYGPGVSDDAPDLPALRELTRR